MRADTYQYQLQALWQKAWATGQGVMQNLRFRERGPFKTWRPETMAEAIMAVLREGLSLSQVTISNLFCLFCLFSYFLFIWMEKRETGCYFDEMSLSKSLLISQLISN